MLDVTARLERVTNVTGFWECGHCRIGFKPGDVAVRVGVWDWRDGHISGDGWEWYFHVQCPEATRWDQFIAWLRRGVTDSRGLETTTLDERVQTRESLGVG